MVNRSTHNSDTSWGLPRTLALFLPTLGVGGTWRVIVNLAQGFISRNVKVDLIVAGSTRLPLTQIPPEVRLIDLGVKRTLFSLPGLVRYLRHERPQVVLSALSQANIVAVWARKISRVPFQLMISERTILSHSSKCTRSLLGKRMPLFAKYFYPWADAVVAVSHGVAEDLVRLADLSAEKVQVIYPPIITPELFKKSEEPVDHPWFQPGEPPVVLGAGRLVAEKDFPTLLRAFALVRKKRNVRLVILGEGEERRKLEALAKELGVAEDVVMPGFVENPYKYMVRARVFALSSVLESLGNVLIEALALKTPVVSTNCPKGPNEILEGGKWGKLVPVGDTQALAKAVDESLVKPPPLNTRSLTPFSLDFVVDHHIKIIKSFQK